MQAELGSPSLYLVSLREEGVLKKWPRDDSARLPSFADSSQWTPQHCFHDHLNFLCVDLYPSYLRHVGVRRVLYNSWWRSKKMSLTGTSTLLEFPVWGTEFGKVFLHQSGHLRVTVRSLAPKGIPFQDSPSFQLAVGLAVHSFAGISSLSHWKPPKPEVCSEPWVHKQYPQEWILLASRH